MRKLPEADRYYLAGYWRNGAKVHIIYFRPCYGSFSGEEPVQACCPNLLVPEVKVGPCSNSYTREMTREDAEYLDQFHNEVTCPTCLKMAQGNNQAVMQFKQGVS